MQTRKIIVLLAVLIFAASSAILLANAVTENEGSLQSGYYITSNYHGIDVPLGTSVHVWALTTDPTVVRVEFIWRDGSDVPQFDYLVTSGVADGTFTDSHGNILTVYKFDAGSQVVDTVGDWSAQAIFYPAGAVPPVFNTKLAIRATSFNVIPEIPLLGTVGASIAMFAGLAYKLKRKPQMAK